MVATRILLMSALLGTKCWLAFDTFAFIDEKPGLNPQPATPRQSNALQGVEALSWFCLVVSAFRSASSLVVPNTSSRFELLDEPHEVLA
jgi:hypothetical protein